MTEELTLSIVSPKPTEQLIVILFVALLPASSLTMKYLPDVVADADGSVIVNGADAETPIIQLAVVIVWLAVTFR